MSKYIDAEKLKTELNKHIELLENGDAHPEVLKRVEGTIKGYKAALSIIDSLQQEQQDCHTVEDWIQHIQNADQLTKDIFSKGPYDVLYDALNHPYQHCYDAIKEFGELCFQTGVNSVKQEQPEVDLEKYIENEINHYGLSLYEASYGTFSASQIDRIIRNAFELGKNSK